MSAHTPEQLKDFAAFEKVRSGGRYNMFDPRAQKATRLDREEYEYTKRNYYTLKCQAEAAKATGADE